MCLLWASKFSPLAWDQTVHLSWWGLWRSIHWVSLYPEAWWPPVGTSARDAFDTGILARGSFLLGCLPPRAHHSALYFWMQNITDHMELQSIFFALLKIKKGALFLCILQFPSSPFEEPLCDCRSIQSPPPFVSLLSSQLLCPRVHGLHSVSLWEEGWLVLCAASGY